MLAENVKTCHVLSILQQIVILFTVMRCRVVCTCAKCCSEVMTQSEFRLRRNILGQRVVNKTVSAGAGAASCRPSPTRRLSKAPSGKATGTEGCASTCMDCYLMTHVHLPLAVPLHLHSTAMHSVEVS